MQDLGLELAREIIIKATKSNLHYLIMTDPVKVGAILNYQDWHGCVHACVSCWHYSFKLDKRYACLCIKVYKPSNKNVSLVWYKANYTWRRAKKTNSESA